jgi:hypothetical protein
MKTLYRILIADDQEAVAKSFEKTVKKFFADGNAVGETVTIEINAKIGYKCDDPGEDIDSELQKYDCVIFDLDWPATEQESRQEDRQEAKVGFKLCKRVRSHSKDLSRDIPCYIIIYSGTATKQLWMAYESHDEIKDSMYNLDCVYNLWYVKLSARYKSQEIAGIEQIRKGMVWHYGCKIRKILKDADRDSLRSLKSKALQPGVDNLEVAESIVVLADGSKVPAEFLFAYLPWGENFPMAVAQEIGVILGTGSRDNIFLDIMGDPTYLVFHVPPIPTPYYRDAQKRPTIQCIREDKLLEEVLVSLKPIRDSEPETPSMNEERSIVESYCKNIEQMLVDSDEVFRDRARAQLGSTETLRYRHTDGGRQIEKQVKDNNWSTESVVILDKIPFKHMWRIRIDEFFHHQDERFFCSERCNNLGEMSFLMFRPFLVNGLAFLTREYRPEIDVIYGKGQSELIILFTYAHGELAKTFGVRGETMFTLIPFSFYAKVAGEDSNNRIVIFEGLKRPELVNRFWEGFNVPRCPEGSWRIALKCCIL